MLNYNDYIENLISSISDDIPESMSSLNINESDLLSHGAYKSAYNEKGMFAFVSWQWVEPFAQWIGNRRVLEVMAGRGWLTHALRDLGVDVIATDDYSWHNKKGWDVPLTNIESVDAIDSVYKYGIDIDILIISWPYMDDSAYRTIKALYEVNPYALVVYIGEGSYGCTADDAFHESFEEFQDDWFNEYVYNNFERWIGIHDYPCVGRYNPEKDKNL